MPQEFGRPSSKVYIHNMLANQAQLRESSMCEHFPPSAASSPPLTQSASTTSLISCASNQHRERSKSGVQREMVWVDSKERLSEMATNIRGISTALSNVCLDLSIRSIVIVTKLSDEALPRCASEMVDWLLGLAESNQFKQLQVSVQDELARRPAFGYEKLVAAHRNVDKCLKLWNLDDLRNNPEKCDLIVALGGDGTVLYTSWLFQKTVPPVMSFGLGSLGFMTENDFDFFREIMSDHFENGISCALRMRFQCTIMRSKNPTKGDMDTLRREIEIGGLTSHFTTHTKGEEYVILNDVVVDRGPNAVITMTELYGNYELLTSIKADGVVVSTPTGSTAYSMSTGGSLVHPDCPATIISPICPHTLSFRPLVLPDNMILHIGVPYDARCEAYAAFDGKERIQLRQGDFLTITASRFPFPKVLPHDYTSVHWVQQLSKTLHWNEQKRPKRYTY